METAQLQRLSALYNQISAVDEEIGHLFQERLTLVQEAEDVRLTDDVQRMPDVEKTVIGSELMKKMLTNRKEMPSSARVACQGVEGAFSHQAADCFFAEPELCFYTQFEDVFQAVERGEVDYGILPIENSTAGSVGQVYDLMRKYDFYIVKEAKVKVAHCLLAQSGVRISDVAKVYSHPQALGQCAEFLAKHQQMQSIPYSNTAAAAKYIADEGDRQMAAVASRKCAEMYGLSVVATNIQDLDQNTTRFICISKTAAFSDKANKISMCLTLPHKPGSLYHLLNKFAINQMNLTKLESRPWPERNFEFMFYLDVEGNLADVKVRWLLDDLNQQLGYFKILGSYDEVEEG